MKYITTAQNKILRNIEWTNAYTLPYSNCSVNLTYYHLYWENPNSTSVCSYIRHMRLNWKGLEDLN